MSDVTIEVNISPVYITIEHEQVTVDASIGQIVGTGTLPDNVVIDCGGHDASTNQFPTTGGTGLSGAIKRGNQFDITVPGTIGGVPVEVGTTIRAKVDTPGQSLNNWRIYY